MSEIMNVEQTCTWLVQELRKSSFVPLDLSASKESIIDIAQSVGIEVSATLESEPEVDERLDPARFGEFDIFLEGLEYKYTIANINITLKKNHDSVNVLIYLLHWTEYDPKQSYFDGIYDRACEYYKVLAKPIVFHAGQTKASHQDLLLKLEGLIFRHFREEGQFGE